MGQRWQVSTHQGCFEGDADAGWPSVNPHGHPPWLSRLSSTSTWGSVSYKNHKLSELEGTSETIWFSPISPRKNWLCSWEVNLLQGHSAFRAEPEVLKMGLFTGLKLGIGSPTFLLKLFQDLKLPWIIAKWLLIRWGCFSNTENFHKIQLSLSTINKQQSE